MVLWTRKPFIAIRLLGRDGHYPSFSISAPNHLYVADSDGPWIAVLQNGLPEDWEIGETVALAPEEVRLLAALTLSQVNPWQYGRPIITHLSEARLAATSHNPDLTSPATYKRIQERVDDLRRAGSPIGSRPSRHLAGDGYHITSIGNQDDAAQILANIDVSDQLLLAGLARLLGATRVIFSVHEMEEGALSLFVAMGAALEFIRLYLEGERQATASYKDVFAFLEEVYPPNSGVTEYFEEMHDHRLIAIHPANRLGEFWAPPLMADDVYWLHRAVIELYRYITLGDPPVE